MNNSLQIIATLTAVSGVVIAIWAAYMLLKSNGLGSENRSVSSETTGANTDTSQRQYLLLRQYHNQGLAQAKISFWFSLIFAGLGFTVIISSIYSSASGEQAVGIIAGVVIEAVAALFFVQSNKARQLMVDFFDRFRNDQKMEEAVRLLRDISDATLRSRVNALIAVHFADISVPESVITEIFGEAKRSTVPLSNGSNADFTSTVAAKHGVPEKASR